MLIRCEGGMLDGHELDQAVPDDPIYQHGLTVLRVHRPYPKRRGASVRDRLLTYSEAYRLWLTAAGPVYRCVAPFGGVYVGDRRVARAADGAYEVWADRAGALSARPAGASDGA